VERKQGFQNDWVKTHEAIKVARTRARLSQEAVGQLFDPPITRNAVAQWEAANGTSPDIDRLQVLARAFNCSIDDLLHGPADLVEEPGRRYNTSPRLSGPKLVPIIGFAIATPKEDGYFDDMTSGPGAASEFAQWHSKDPNAYALRVRGDSMQPRIRPGEVIVVEPNHALVQGKDVLVRTKDGRKMVKQLLFQRSGEVTLGSINQTHQQLTISLEEVESLHYVAGIAHSISEG
jgi:phage repressor protein C with HTH and peptisase S24 domain